MKITGNVIMEYGTEAAERIFDEENILREDEEIIWANTPQEDAYYFTTIWYILFTIGMFWMMIGWVIFAIPSTAMMCFSVIIIHPAIILLVVFFRHSQNRREAFAITDERIVKFHHSALGWIQNIDDLYHEQVIDVDMRKMGFIAKRYDVGNIFFRSRGGATTTVGLGAVGFNLVHNPRKAHQYFRKLVMRDLGGGALGPRQDRKDTVPVKVSPAKFSKEYSLDDVNRNLMDIKQLLWKIEKKL